MLKICFIYFSLQNVNAFLYCSLKMGDPGLKLLILTVQYHKRSCTQRRLGHSPRLQSDFQNRHEMNPECWRCNLFSCVPIFNSCNPKY